ADDGGGVGAPSRSRIRLRRTSYPNERIVTSAITLATRSWSTEGRVFRIGIDLLGRSCELEQHDMLARPQDRGAALSISRFPGAVHRDIGKWDSFPARTPAASPHPEQL